MATQDEKGNATCGDEREIKVTPEMIEAGVEVLRDFFFSDGTLTLSGCESLSRRMLERALRGCAV
jgi:hypothetical protein